MGVLVATSLVTAVGLAVMSAGLSIGLLAFAMRLFGHGPASRIVDTTPETLPRSAPSTIDLRDEVAMMATAPAQVSRRVIRLTLQRTQRPESDTQRMSDLPS